MWSMWSKRSRQRGDDDGAHGDDRASQGVDAEPAQHERAPPVIIVITTIIVTITFLIIAIVVFLLGQGQEQQSSFERPLEARLEARPNDARWRKTAA